MPHGSAGVHLVRRSKSSPKSRRTSSESTRKVRSANSFSVRMLLECLLCGSSTIVCIIVADVGVIIAATWISTTVESSNYEVQHRSSCFSLLQSCHSTYLVIVQYAIELNTHAMQVAVAKGFVVGFPEFFILPNPHSLSSTVIVARHLQPPCSAWTAHGAPSAA